MRHSVLLIAGFAVWVHPISAQTNEYADQCAKETNPDQAVLYCTRAIESGLLSESDLAVAIRNRGIAFGKKDEYDRAIQDFDQAIRLNPSFVKAYFNRGLAYSEMRENDRAIQDFNQAIQLDPNDAGLS